MARLREFTEDLYAVLGVPRDASPEAIRRAARRRQREAHPDTGGSAEEFVRVQVAVEVLGDPAHRAEHDQWLAGRRGGIWAAARNVADSGRVRRRGAREDAGRAPAATRPRAGHAGRRAAAPDAARAESATARREPAPSRIPPLRVDVRSMSWFRTAWPEQAEFWPPARAARPPLTTGEIAFTALGCIAAIVVAVLLVHPLSIARLSFPNLVTGEGGPTLWPVVALFASAALAALVLRLLAIRRGVARGLWIACTTAAVVSVVGASIGAGIAFFASGVSSGSPAFLTFIAQAALYIVFLASFTVAWLALTNHVVAFTRESLLVQLADESAPPADDPRRVWGEPGQTAMSESGVRVSENPMRAALAQRAMGEQLARLTRIPGVRVVHGIRVPGGRRGAIAHAVVSGHRVALIDDRLWAPGLYGVDRAGAVTRDGEAFPTSAVDVPHAVEAFHALFGETAHVRGWIAVVPDREGVVEIDSSLTWQRTRLGTVEQVLREAGNWLAEDGARVDRLLLRDVLAHRA